MEKAGVLVNQECFELEKKNLVRLKSTFVNNIKCFVQRGNFTCCDRVILQKEIDSNCVCEGDTVVVELKYYNDEREVLELTLFEGECDIFNDELPIDSPLGSAILNMEVGSRTSYFIGDNRVYVEILKKVA